MAVLVVTQDWTLPLILTTITLVNGVLADPVAQPFYFDAFYDPDSFNDTVYEEQNDTRPPVWDQIRNDLRNLINDSKLEHRHAEAISSANLEEMKDLLRKSSYNIDNKIRMVETTTKNVVNVAKNRISLENTDMQVKISAKFREVQSTLRNIAENMRSSTTNTVNTVRDLIESGFKTMKNTLDSNFRSLSSLVSRNLTTITPPPPNMSSQPTQDEPETKEKVKQTLLNLTAMIEGMTVDLWSIKDDIKDVKQKHEITHKVQQIQTTKSPQRIHKTTSMSPIITQETTLPTIATQEPDTTTPTTAKTTVTTDETTVAATDETTIVTTEETTTTVNSLEGLFEDLPTVKTEKTQKTDNSFSNLFEVTEKEDVEKSMEYLFQQGGFQEKLSKSIEITDDEQTEGSGVHPRYKRSPIDFSNMINNVKGITDFGRQIDHIWSAIMTLMKRQTAIKENIAINNEEPDDNGEQKELKPYDDSLVKVDVPFEVFEADKVLDRIDKLNTTVIKMADEQKDEGENENKREFNWKYITVTISVLSFLSSLTYCMWACVCSRYKLKKKAYNRYPYYQYWSVKKDECEIDFPRPVPNQQPPIQPEQPRQCPKHQFTVEDPRLPVPNLQAMAEGMQRTMAEGMQRSGPQNPDENPKITYTDATKR